jgi:uncharacterized membrane protein YraQ (UPF0718 family)
MISHLQQYWTSFSTTVWSISVESAPWVVLSLIVGGLVHEFIATGQLRRHLNRHGVAGLVGAVILGMVLPICSCGVIPLAVSLYRSGLRTGTVMAFAAATPIINPAAVILAFALLGPKITAAYILLGLALPILLGTITERWGEVTPLPSNNITVQTTLDGREHQAPLHWTKRIVRGMHWGAVDLGPSIGFYLVIGIVLAALLMTFVPQDWMTRFLGGDSLLGLFVVAILGASIYVCAVANIPFAAALLAAGAGPGAAIVFLVTGTATNLPELLTLYNTIGRRTVIIYALTLIVASLIVGLVVNAWLLPGFVPTIDPLHSVELVATSARWQPTVSAAFAATSVYLMLLLSGVGAWQRIRRRFFTRATAPSCCSGSSCCGD